MSTKLNSQPYIKLQYFAQEISELPVDWGVVDDAFSKEKRLFDYQVEALTNAVKVLYKYFEEWKEDKSELVRIYEDLEIYKELNINLKKHKYPELLKEFFTVEIDENRNEIIPFREFANRMSFWMATGSGKTLIIIKLIDILHTLMEKGLIPKKEILFLTYREDLLQAFKKLVEEFNKARPMNKQIKLVNLKDYEREKKFGTLGRRVFIYRSDLISDEKKENILNFRDFLSSEDEKPFGDWYLILDEAHKGDKEESKRQVIYSILSQKGFLFNFSATFTSPIDIVTTVYNLNLSEFISRGYGKQIYVSQEEAKAFKDKEDFRETEKRKIILKTLIMLSTIKKAYDRVREKDLYHNPLLIYLVNSVNVKASDLKLVFNELAKLGKSIDENLFEECREELVKELRNAKYTLGDKSLTLEFFEDFLRDISVKDLYKYVYNSSSGGNIEYIVNPDNKQELALKLDNSDSPFALVKIGDTSKWIKEFLIGYKENETFRETGFFETLNNKDSPINILMGSRSFYEGWDSNRPNVITFINIGTGTDAKKFVLQAIGRGIRIEPVKNKRKRLEFLGVNEEIAKNLYEKFKNEAKALETLIVFATNKNAVQTILTELEMVIKAEGFETISLWENEKAKDYTLLIPVYKKKDGRILNQENPIRFRMSRENLELLKEFLKLMPRERFIFERNVSPNVYEELIKVISENKKFIYYLDGNQNYKDVDTLIDRLINHLNAEREEIEGFRKLRNEIVHFRKIKVREDYRKEFLEKINRVKEAVEMTKEEKWQKLMELQEKGFSPEEAIEEVKKKSHIEIEIDDVKIRKLLKHYYIPIVYANNKVDWIKHIISTESEYHFINALINIIDDIDKHYDWWMFSKLDEHLDKDIYIPYISGGKLRKFIPDFIFWLKKGNDYTIFFIDPKSYMFTSFEDKVEGYKAIYIEENKEKTFLVQENKEKLLVKVKLKLYTPDGVDNLGKRAYKEFWTDENRLLDDLLNI